MVLFYFTYTLIFACHTSLERRHVGAIFFLFLGAALFWSGFEQAGSSMNLFAEEFTNRTVVHGVSWLDPIPTGWLQNVNPLFIVLLAPVVGSLWVKLGARNPSVGLKFAMGLMLLGVGFFVLAWGAHYTNAGKVGMQWLVVTYFFHTVGELCLSPVGLSFHDKTRSRSFGQPDDGNLVRRRRDGKPDCRPRRRFSREHATRHAFSYRRHDLDRIGAPVLVALAADQVAY